MPSQTIYSSEYWVKKPALPSKKHPNFTFWSYFWQVPKLISGYLSPACPLPAVSAAAERGPGRAAGSSAPRGTDGAPPGAPRSGPAAFPLAAGHKRPRAGPARWARPPQGPPRAAPGTHRQGRAGLRQRRALPADRRNVTTRPHPLRASAAGAAAGRAVKGVPRSRVPANGGNPQNSPAPP